MLLFQAQQFPGEELKGDWQREKEVVEWDQQAGKRCKGTLRCAQGRKRGMGEGETMRETRDLEFFCQTPL